MNLDSIKGTPLGGQTIKLQGYTFGTTPQVVMFGAYAATVVEWTNLEVTVKTPRVPFTLGTVAVTTLTFTAQFQYLCPLTALVEDELLTRVRGASIEDGYFFNHTATNQVKRLKGDPWVDATTEAYPRTYMCFVQDSPKNDEPCGFDKSEVDILVIGCVKNDTTDPEFLDYLCHAYYADISRAVLSARNASVHTNDIRCTQCEFMAADVDGTMEVNMMFHVEVQHVIGDNTRNEGVSV